MRWLCRLGFHAWTVARVQTFRHLNAAVIHERCRRCPETRGRSTW